MISMAEAKFWFMQYIMTLINTPYLWGGDDPMAGFDCSGMVIEGLQSVGAIPIHRDYSADGLWHKYHAIHEVEKPVEGCLAFWFNNAGKAIHVAVCLDGEICLTADGGGRRVKGLGDAIKFNAFIKIRPIDHRKPSEPRFVNLFGVT